MMLSPLAINCPQSGCHVRSSEQHPAVQKKRCGISHETYLCTLWVWLGHSFLSTKLIVHLVSSMLHRWLLKNRWIRIDRSAVSLSWYCRYCTDTYTHTRAHQSVYVNTAMFMLFLIVLTHWNRSDFGTNLRQRSPHYFHPFVDARDSITVCVDDWSAIWNGIGRMYFFPSIVVQRRNRLMGRKRNR